jgi:hypothetical protein
MVQATKVVSKGHVEILDVLPPAEEQQEDRTPETEAASEATASAHDEADKAAELNERAVGELKAGTREFAKGEKASRLGKLMAGKHYHQYIRLRLAAGLKSRETAVMAIAGEIAKHANDRVDVNGLIRCYHAYRLLGEEAGVKAAADHPFGHYVNGWSTLVCAVNEGTGEEDYVLLPGLEGECKAAFSQAVKVGEGRDAVVKTCSELKDRSHQPQRLRGRGPEGCGRDAGSDLGEE